MNERKNIILKIKEYFKNQPVIRAYLFGSFGRGQESPQSDVDVLVELDYSKNVGLEFIQMKLDLESLLNKKVDLVSANGLSKYIKPIIDKEKKLIYARGCNKIKYTELTMLFCAVTRQKTQL